MRAAIALVVLGLSGCSLTIPSLDYADDGGVADAGIDGGEMDSGTEDGGADAGFDGGGDVLDSGFDAGLGDAGPGDAGVDSATCVPDPSPTGIGLCTSDDGCPPHCSSNWEGHCVFGAYSRPRGTGTCIYRDCRLDPFEVDVTPHCPTAEPRLCPEQWCGRPAAPIACPSAVQTCVY